VFWGGALISLTLPALTWLLVVVLARAGLLGRAGLVVADTGR
jgi:hypothetical protein